MPIGADQQVVGLQVAVDDALRKAQRLQAQTKQAQATVSDLICLITHETAEACTHDDMDAEKKTKCERTAAGRSASHDRVRPGGSDVVTCQLWAYVHATLTPNPRCPESQAEAHLGVAVLKRQHRLRHIHPRGVLVERAQVAQQRVTVAAVGILHDDVEVVATGEAVVKPHLDNDMTSRV